MKKNSQTWLAIIVLFIIIVLGLKLFLYQRSFLAVWLIAIAIGFVLYRSGICFASMYQDIFLFRDFSMARAILILLIVSLIGINSLQLMAHLNAHAIPGKFHSVGVHTIAGGFMFGLGMTLAGGCASGTLQRIAEGFLLFWFVLSGMVAGSVLGAYHFDWWVSNFYSHESIFLPNVCGWVAGGLLSLAVLAGLYFLTFRLEGKTFFKINEMGHET